MSQTPKRNWGHLHLPPDLIDAIRFLAKRNGYEGKEHLYLFNVLKQQQPDEMGMMIPLYGMGWMDDEDPSG